MRRGAIVAGLVAITVFATVASADDSWRELRPLVGRWEGTGAGFGNTSAVSHEWTLVLDEQFLRLQTRSVSVGKDGNEEVHEDVGYVSWDSDRETFVFRQFLSEGYVNTFDVAVQTGEVPGVHFNYRDAESAGGVRAQMRLDFASSDEYGMVLDLAFPGKDFAACQEMQMRRVGASP